MTGSVDITDIRMALGISAARGEVVHLLLENKVVSTADLVANGVTSPRKVIMALRYKLRGLTPEITIHSHKKLGYWIDQTDKDRLAVMCRQDIGNEIEVDDDGNIEVV